MSENKLPTRIASEDLENVRTWLLPPVNDSGRVLSSAEKEARERKERLLKQGKEKIETIEINNKPKSAMTASMVQEVFDSAHKDGFAQGHSEGFQKGEAEGYEAGRQQGLNEYRNQIAVEKERFQKIISSLINPIEEQDNDIEHFLLDIVCTLTQSVIQRELQIDSSQILNLVKQAMDALPVGSKNIRILLNPKDLEVIESYAYEQQLDWKFLADPLLGPGGCKVETPESRVDFSVSSRLQSVLEQFLSGQLAKPDVEDLTEED